MHPITTKHNYLYKQKNRPRGLFLRFVEEFVNLSALHEPYGTDMVK